MLTSVSNRKLCVQRQISYILPSALAPPNQHVLPDCPYTVWHHRSDAHCTCYLSLSLLQFVPPSSSESTIHLFIRPPSTTTSTMNEQQLPATEYNEDQQISMLERELSAKQENITYVWDQFKQREIEILEQKGEQD